jgi:formylglycine-generating enzyme required for sulfatase activity
MKGIFFKCFGITAALVLAGCPGFTGPGDSPFVPVAGISGVPDTATVGEGLELGGTVEPAEATNRAIAWSVKDQGATGAVIDGGKLKTTAPGEAVVAASVAGGLGASSDYVQDFRIAVRPGLASVITTAQAAKTGVVLSADGSDVVPNAQWATQAAFDALNQALSAAEITAQNPAAARADIDAATAALTEATAAFNAAKQAGAKAAADKTTLAAALSGANAAKTGVAVSADGSDVEPDTQWAAQAAFAALNGAIGAAEALSLDSAASQADLDAAAAALTQATAAFNAAKQAGAKTAANKAALTAAIAAANTAKTGVAVSADGNDVEQDAQWATPAALAALNGAIGAAEALSLDSAASQADIDGAATALTQATTSFNTAKQKGAKTESGSTADKTALNAALAAANAAKTGVAASTDGSDIEAAAQWATQAAFAAFNGAIAAAETAAQNTAADQAEVDAATAALTEATAAFNTAKQTGTKPPPVDKTALNAALAAANAAKTGVAASTDGSDIEAAAQWATQAAFAAFNGAIAVAETAAQNTAADQAEVDAAAAALTEATAAFNAAKQAGTKPPPVDKTALNAALAAAHAAKIGVAVSTDGSDIGTTAQWATQAAFAAFNGAIAAAETAAQNTIADQTEIAAAAAALTEATATFNAAKQAGTKPPPANKTALEAALAGAHAAKTGVAVSEDGSDVPADTFRVTQAVLDTFNAAIAAAETVSLNPAATQAEADAATAALAQAIAAFNAAKRKGTQPVTLRTVSVGNGVSFNLRSVSPPGPGGFKYDGGISSVAAISKGYWMGETEATQELFQAVMGTNPSYFKTAPAAGETQNKRPVEDISWYAAIAFCNKLSLLDGKTPVYSVKIAGVEVDWANLSYDDIPGTHTGNSDWNRAVKRNVNGYRLPYEMEWMWAAMGGNEGGSTATSNGHAKPFAGSDGANSIGDHAWNSGNAANKTHETGKKLPNELGLYDMSGNVAEWCWEEEGKTDFARHSTPDEPARMYRGGGWSSSSAVCAVGYRGEEAHEHPSKRFRSVGIRLVCDQ